MEITCPDCQAQITLTPTKRRLQCTSCASRFTLRGHICPVCSAFHREETAICGSCGQPLTRTCPRCQTSNWSGAEMCSECGGGLAILDLITHPVRRHTSDRLDRQMKEAPRIKRLELLASDRRMAELMAIEEARQSDLQQRIANKKRQERQLLLLVFATVLLFLAVLVIYAFFGSFA